MKHLIVSLLAAIIIAPVVYGQEDEIRSHEIGVSFNLYDFKTAELIRTTSLNAVIRDKQFGDEKSPGIGLHYFKGLKKHIDFAGSFNASYLNQNIPDNPDPTDRYMFQLEAAAHFKLVTDKYWFQPYLIGGFGAQKYYIYYGAYMPLGVGLNINFFNEGRLFINSTYRVPITTGTTNYHFMHAFGIAGRLTKKKEPVVIPPPPPPVVAPKDSDNDGITDNNDKCPNVAGVAKYEGCPVPDTDKDGINDENDKCPSVAGLAKYEGCPVPDTDKDGINDEEDKCPNQPGVARYQGCPVPDTDGDSVNDEEDKCPKVAGPADNFGCPVIGIKSYEIVFKTGSAVLLSKGKPILDTVVAYLKRNSDVEVTIDGHTDNVGSDKVNNPLSVKRAEATKKYLVSKGINADRLVTAGFGSTQPVADNNTAEGRQKNRRIEIKIKG
jgi:OmpA-OmpF porin, OOP family